MEKIIRYYQLKINNMFTGILHLHKTVVILFLLIYLVKTVLLLMNNNNLLQKLTKTFKVPEMIISTLFLLSGIYLSFNIPFPGTMFWVKLVCVFVSIPLAVIGFKKSNKALAVLSLLLIISAYGLAEMSKRVAKKEIVVKANEDLGKAVYNAQCSNCHGTDGKLGLAGAKNLGVSNLSKEEIVSLINNGKNAMPKFNDVLTEEQKISVAQYVINFRE